MDTIKVFVGSVAETWLPLKVLESSILRRTNSPVEVKPLCEWDHLIPDKWQKRAATPFSFQRFLIPEICEHKGRGIYLDSDMILRTDIRELWEHKIPDGRKIISTPGWQTAVMLYDCNIEDWSMEKLIGMLEWKRMRYGALMNLRGFPELKRCLDPMWDCMDRPRREKIDRPEAKLMHFTWMPTQPWLYDKHPKGHLWTTELLHAVESGVITKEDVMREIEREHVHPYLAMVIGEDEPNVGREFIPPNERRKATA